MENNSMFQKVKDTFTQKFCKKEAKTNKTELIIEKDIAQKHKGLSQVAKKHKKLAEQNDYSFLADRNQEDIVPMAANSESTTHSESE